MRAGVVLYSEPDVDVRVSGWTELKGLSDFPYCSACRRNATTIAHQTVEAPASKTEQFGRSLPCSPQVCRGTRCSWVDRPRPSIAVPKREARVPSRHLK